jgi:hypothetical protein
MAGSLSPALGDCRRHLALLFAGDSIGIVGADARTFHTTFGACAWLLLAARIAWRLLEGHPARAPEQDTPVSDCLGSEVGAPRLRFRRHMHMYPDHRLAPGIRREKGTRWNDQRRTGNDHVNAAVLLER